MIFDKVISCVYASVLDKLATQFSKNIWEEQKPITVRSREGTLIWRFRGSTTMTREMQRHVLMIKKKWIVELMQKNELI